MSAAVALPARLAIHARHGSIAGGRQVVAQTERKVPGQARRGQVRGAEDRLSEGASILRVMSTFAVRLVHGPGWDTSRPIRRQDAWVAHAGFMDALVEEGFIIVGGPVGDREQTLHLVEAADESEIRARLAEDPWASAGLLQIGAIEPWALWLDGR